MVEDAPLTDLIRRAQNGDRHALKSVFDVTYDELRLDVTEHGAAGLGEGAPAAGRNAGLML